MVDEGIMPSAEEDAKRRDVVKKLKQMVLAWIKVVAWIHELPKSKIEKISATVLTYGSYSLGAHGPESDIDALCVGPSFATMAEDFFVVLHNMLQFTPQVSDIHCVKDAKVPLMRFKFNGISIDLPYARLGVCSVLDGGGDLGEQPQLYKQGMVKTELCKTWKERGTCRYGEQCQFAHGIEELRLVIRHPDYKTKICRTIISGATCVYGHRCHFRHSLDHNEEKEMLQKIDILRQCSLMDIDETSKRSLSGVRANVRICQILPNMEKFKSVLRCLKLWAKRRGVYCNLLGFFGGIQIMVLTAYVCKKSPKASIAALIAIFFETFAAWPWPKPVTLEDALSLTGEATESHSLMPIQLPGSPNEFCHSTITWSTYNRIRAEFLRGRAITRGMLRPDFQWNYLFEPFPYTKMYTHFVCIFLAASNKEELTDWVGWVKSRFRSLLFKLEGLQGFCDPNPTEYTSKDVTEPNIAFYWGLHSGPSSFTDAESVENYFLNHIRCGGYQGPIGRLKFSFVDSSQSPKEVQTDSSCIEKVYERILAYYKWRKLLTFTTEETLLLDLKPDKGTPLSPDIR